MILLLVGGWGACTGKVTPEASSSGASSPSVPEIAFVEDPTADGLVVELYDAQPPSDALVRPPLAPARPLDAAAIDALLGRAPPLEGVDGDREAFALRPGSPPPPLPGSDVHEAFPPPTRPDVPAVAAGPVHVTRHQPDGEVPIAPHVSVTFDQPMVAVTSQEEASKTVPVRLTPTPPGRWRWLGTRTLLFDPDPRLPMATEYTIEVPAGTRSATGQALAEPARFTFATPPPTLQASWPSGGPQGLEPVVVLSFDQRVDPERVLERVVLSGGSEPVRLRLATDAEIAADKPATELVKTLEPGRWVAARAASPLRPNTSYSIEVPAGTPSAEGPRVTTASQWGSFYTYPPLTLTAHHCWYQDPCPPTAPWTLEFSNPLEPGATDLAAFSVSPEVPGLSARIHGDTVQLSGDFTGRTTYRVTVPTKVGDVFGQAVDRGQEVTFQTGPADKTLSSAANGPMVVLDPKGGAKLPIFSTNHPSLRVTIHRVGPDDWAAWQKWLQSLYYDDNKPKRLPGTPVWTGTVVPPAAKDRLVESAVDFAPYLADGVGQFLVLVEPSVQPRERWNRQYVYHWVQATRIGLVGLVDGQNVLGWASDLSTGASLSGVELALRSGGGATTGDDGLGACALPTSGGDLNNLLVARKGSDLAILPESESPWGGTAWVRRSDLAQLRWYVADDRGLYRPGEHVRVKGWLRRSDPGPTGDIHAIASAGGKVGWRLVSSMGDEMGTGSAPISGLGGFSLDLALPPEANLGTATLVLTAEGVGSVDGIETTHPIRIEEFRRPEFEVTATADADAHFLGEKATADVTAAYYAGGALPSADVVWNVYAAEGSYSPPGWSDWSFGTWIPWWREWSNPRGEQHVGTLEGKTDATGAHHLGMHFAGLNPPRPTTVRVESTVLDVNRQAWTASDTILVHPASLYVGLKTERAFVEKGEDVDVRVAVVDVDGKPAPASAELVFARMESEWDPVAGYREVESDPKSCVATAGSDGTTRCAFHTVTGGSYRVLATVRDGAGRKNQSELRIWVSGAEVQPSREVQLEELTLVPQTRELHAGDTASILVQSPFWPAEGLVTLRRDGLVKTERLVMSGPTTTLSIPIVDAYVPDITVQVDLAGAAHRVDDAGELQADLPDRVAHATAAITFPVPPVGRTLAVTATPAAEEVAPGSESSIALEVRGPRGGPVAGAELAVVVADESVLALTGYRLPDPLELFYASRGAGVSDYRSRQYVALADPRKLSDRDNRGPVGAAYPAEEQAVLRQVVTLSAAPGRGEAEKKAKEGAKDDEADYEFRADKAAAVATGAVGGESAAPIAMRADFSALALFAPDVRTDAQGRATVPLKLPDSLTRYRVMVVAVDADHGFGSAEAAITARLPLMVRPSAPRFLNFGDQFELPVVVQNQTDAPMTVDVAVRATNVRFVDAIGPTLPDLPDVALSTAGKRVEVPANDRVEVRFPAATLLAGRARFQAVGASGAASDAASFDLPVWTPATTEAFATYGEIDGPGVVQPVTAPPGVWPQFGGLQVTTSSTQLQALTDAVLYLQSYPFDCNEQISSRVLAIASLRDVLSAFESPDLPPARELEAQVDRDLQRLAARQHWNGGFSFWRKGDPTWPFLSIHVANAFARAKAKGYDVPADAWSQSQYHLENIEQFIPGWYSIEARWFLRAYAIDVLRRMGAPAPRKALALYKEAGTKLGIDGLAFLLPTLHDAKSATEEAAILGYLANNVTEEAGTAHFVTGYSDGEYVLLHSDRRADGIVLEAMMDTRPDSELVAKVVRGLLAHKTKGRWGNTQENAFVLLALDRYFHVYEKETPDFVARVWLGDDYAGEHAFRGRTTERSRIDIPMGLLTERRDPQPLTLARDGKSGRMYYRVGMTYAPRDLKLEAADYGFAVERRYEAIDDPADVSRDADGTWRVRAGARVRVHLSMATEMRRYHVALVDPLPAGLEAQNPALATTGTLPEEPPDAQPRWWWWTRTWYEHENLRDDRVEAYTSLLWDGVHEYSYVARATTPGRYVVPPTKAEEMYMPETFGRSSTDRLVVE